MTTLKEILDEFEMQHAGQGVAVLARLDAIESWAYGQEKECGETDCTGDSLCHGTGTIREPGLVERLDAVLNDERSYGKNLPELLLAALREELGER